MSTTQFSDLQLVNLSMLMTMRDNIHRDLAGACCKFGLHAEQAKRFADASMEQILAMVANVGQECLFPPREDLLELLKVPAALSAAITAVRPLSSATSCLDPVTVRGRPLIPVERR